MVRLASVVAILLAAAVVLSSLAARSDLMLSTRTSGSSPADTTSLTTTNPTGTTSPADPALDRPRDEDGPASMWVLDSGTVDDRPVRPLATRAVTLALGDDGISGHAGCNSYHATFGRSLGGTSFLAVATTRLLCPPAVMAVEALVVTGIGRVTTVVEAGGRLTLSGDGVRLAFIPSG